MSRSGYHDDCDQWSLIRWRGAVNSAIRGQRGQKLLTELRDAMDAMPEKKLITDQLEADGCYCALGVVGKARGISLEPIDPHCAEQVSGEFDIAEALAREIVFVNDEQNISPETDEQRWQRVRAWVASQIATKEPS